MSACPIKTDPAWVALTDKYGYAKAMTAYKNNNNAIPTIEEAEVIFNNMRVKEKDEILSSSSDEFKLERAKAQAELMDKAALNASPAQMLTIVQLQKMNMAYQNFLQDNIDAIQSGKPGKATTSVSKFTGTSEFKGDPTEYEAFKLFGTFVHEILELAQVAAIEQNVRIDKIYTREFFDEIYTNYIKKNPFTIENLDMDEMFAMGQAIVLTVNESNKKDFLILPEVTVFGDTAAGTPIVGRLDLLLIDKSGKIQIFDFKTKKLKHLMQWNSFTNQYETNVDAALYEMAMKENTLSNTSGTGTAFRQIGSRSVYDSWILQLGVYENILKQNGLEMVEHKNKTIVSLLYQVDKDRSTNTNDYRGSYLYVFDGEDYYNLVRNTAFRQNGEMWNTVDSTNEHVLKLKKAVEKEIPTGEDLEESTTTKSIDDVYDVTPTEQNIKNFNERIKSIIEGQIKKLTADIKTAKTQATDKRSESLIKILETRLESINQFKTIVEKLESSNPSEILYATNFANAMSNVEQDLEEISNVSIKATEVYNDPASTPAQRNKALVEVTTAYNKGYQYKAVIDVLEEIINDRMQAENSKLTPQSPALIKLTQVRILSNIISSNFKDKVAMKNAVEVFQTLGEKRVEKVSEQIKQTAFIELETINKEIERLKSGAKLNFFAKAKFALFSLTDKDFKDKFKEAIGPNGKIVLSRIEQLEKQKIKKEFLLNGIELTDDFIESYINGITNPGSTFYPGMQNMLQTDSILSGWNMDPMIASASNSDLAVAALTNMLKEHKAQSEHSLMTDEKLKVLIRNLNALLEKGYSQEDLNKFISEWREIEFLDENGERMKRNVFDIAKPYSVQYENTYKNYSIRLKEFNKEIYELKSEYNKKFKTPEKAVAEKALEDKKKERDDFNNEYIQWLLDNASLPYSDKFYELQIKLPNEVRDKIQKLYLEQEGILFDVGKGNEALLNEDDLERLEEIDFEIRKLRLDAQESNEDYAQYLQELDELYEFDLNENAFKRAEAEARVRFADDPERMKIWEQKNSVTRPNSAWYDEVSALYEERAELYGSDPQIQELMTQKRKIMAPYRINGRFNPKYLTDDEVLELNKIESYIENIIEENRKNSTGSTLDEFQKQRANEITERLTKLVTPVLNPIYEEDFDQRYRVLTARYNELFVAEKALTTLDENPSSTQEELDNANSAFFQAVANLGTTEELFKMWYEKNHSDAYVSISVIQDHKNKRVPRSFNFEKLPSNSLSNQFMETVPNPKYYKIKRLRIGNWTLDGNKLRNADITELKKNPQEMEDLLLAGRLIAKQGAINEDFLKSPDGIPMPKEIKMSSNGHYYIDSNAGVSENVSEKFATLMSNPEMLNLYNSLTDVFFDLQIKTQGRKMGYQVPGFAAGIIESIASLGYKEGFKKQYKAFMDKHLKLQSEQDASTNMYGDSGDSLRMKFSTQLSEDIQSEDALGSVIKWATEAHMNIGMQEVAPKSEAFIAFLELQAEQLKQESLSGDVFTTNEKGERIKLDVEKKLKEVENAIELMKYENKKFLYGISESEENRRVKKIVDGFFKYTSFIRIGFDVANQVKNFTSGNVQSWLAAGGSDSDHYTKKDWRYAKGKLYGYDGFIANYFKDWGKVDELSDSTQLYRIINPAQKDPLKYYSELAGGKKRRIQEKLANVDELGYILQDKGDTEIAVTVMYAVMNNYKYEVLDGIDPATGEKIFKRDANGDKIYVSAHEAYVQDSAGNLVIREDVNYDKKEEHRLRTIIYSEMRRAQGNYASADQTKFESKTIGKMVFFFRKFLVPQFLNRFGYLRANWEASEVAMGYWRATARAIKLFGVGNTAKEFLLGSNLMSKVGMAGGTRMYQIKDHKTGKVIETKDIGDFYSKRVRHARQDAIMMTLLTVLSMALLSYVRRKDDDDEEIGILAGNAIRVIWGTKAETVSMFPVGEGSNEYVKNFTTAIPFMREAQAGKNLISHSLKYAMALTMNGGEEPDKEYDSELYQEIWKDAFYTRKYGAYEKGDAKLTKDFVDLTGIKNFRDLLNPQYRIDVLKGKQ